MNDRKCKTTLAGRCGLVIALAGLVVTTSVATDDPADSIAAQAVELSPAMARLVENAGRGLSPGVQDEIRAFAFKHQAEGGMGPRHDGLPPGLEMILRRQAAGTYWNTSTIEGFPPVYNTVSYGDDGTTMFSSQFHFGGLIPAKYTPAYGEYRFTGVRESKSVWLSLAFDLDGVPTAAARVTRTDNWAYDFCSNEGEFEWREYDLAAGEDPLDPEDGTIVGVGTYSEERLQFPDPDAGLPWGLQHVLRRQAAGTYWLSFDLPGVPTLYSTHRYGADGTTMWSSQLDFGYVIGLKGTPAYGEYRFTGLRESEALWITLVFDLDGAPLYANRITAVARWDHDFASAEGEFTYRQYDLTLGEDPLDPEDGTFMGEGPYTMQRLEFPDPDGGLPWGRQHVLRRQAASATWFTFGDLDLKGTTGLHGDGTGVFSTQLAFGGIDGVLGTPWYGLWRFTARREVEYVWLRLDFDLDGVPTLVRRVDGRDVWADDFSFSEGEFEVRLYDLSLGEDPLDIEQGTLTGPPQIYFQEALEVPLP